MTAREGNLGRNIAQHRKEAKLTQEELAKKVGIHKNYLSAIENGHFKPSRKLVSQIAAYLNVKVESLL